MPPVKPLTLWSGIEPRICAECGHSARVIVEARNFSQQTQTRELRMYKMNTMANSLSVAIDCHLWESGF